MKRSEIIDFIKATSPKLTLGSLTAYETIPVTDDLVNEDIPSWGNVNDLIDGTSLASIIPIWASGSYVQDAAVRVLINDVWYLFASQVNNNETEPSLTETDPELMAWDLIGENPNSEPNIPHKIVVASGTQLTLIGDTYYYNIPVTLWDDYGEFPDVRVIRNTQRIWVDHLIELNFIRIPLPDINDSGQTTFSYTLQITK